MDGTLRYKSSHLLARILLSDLFQVHQLAATIQLMYQRQPGNYTFQAYFATTVVTIQPGSFFIVYPPGTYTWPAAESPAITVSVQSTAIQAWPETPLPTSYWTLPIFAENQNWYDIAGNWLVGAADREVSENEGALLTTLTDQLLLTYCGLYL